MACGQETNSIMARRITELRRTGKGRSPRLSKNDPAGSLVHFQRAASEFPNFYEACHAMGLAQPRLGHREEAELAFQKSIDASGGHYAELHFGLSAPLCDQQRFSEAEPIIRKALELAPGFGSGHFILACALFPSPKHPWIGEFSTSMRCLTH
jgi:tetratricopeptide (TPR) repeat protein